MNFFDMNNQKRTRHHRKRSSVASISASTAANSEKILEYQSLERRLQEHALPSKDFVVTDIIVHSTTALTVFHLECFSPYGHWFTKKKNADFIEFEKLLKKVFPVESGHKGGKRITPKISIYCHLPEIIIKVERAYRNCKSSIQHYLNGLLTCSPIISRSQLLSQFLKSDIVELDVQELSASFTKISISSPWIDAPKMYCEITTHEIRPTPKRPWIELHVEDVIFPISDPSNLTLSNICQITGACNKQLPYKCENELQDFIAQYKIGKNAGIIHIRHTSIK